MQLIVQIAVFTQKVEIIFTFYLCVEHTKITHGDLA